MRGCLVATLLLLSSVIASAQTSEAVIPVGRKWRVTVVETVPLPPLQITDPLLRVVDDEVTGESRVELTFVATNLTDESIGTNLSLWIHEFAGGFPAPSWLFDDLAVPAIFERIGPRQQVRIRAPYREGFDRRLDTWLMISLKSATTGATMWAQPNPWKRAVSVMRGDASPRLADIRYDEFMDLAVDERKSVFNYVPAESKARLMRTHLERYLTSHGDMLTRDQRILVEDMMATITARSYVLPRDEATERRLRDLETRAKLLFTEQEILEVLTLLP
jgi:hypothetical protein